MAGTDWSVGATSRGKVPGERKRAIRSERKQFDREHRAAKRLRNQDRKMIEIAVIHPEVRLIQKRRIPKGTLRHARAAFRWAVVVPLG